MDAMYSTENIVNNIVTTLATEDSQIYHGDYIIVYINVESLCCTPEINIILYTKYTSIIKKNPHPESPDPFLLPPSI